MLLRLQCCGAGIASSYNILATTDPVLHGLKTLPGNRSQWSMECSVHTQLEALKASKDSAHQGNAMVIIILVEATGIRDGKWGLTSRLCPTSRSLLQVSLWKQTFGSWGFHMVDKGQSCGPFPKLSGISCWKPNMVIPYSPWWGDPAGTWHHQFKCSMYSNLTFDLILRFW